MSNVGKNPNSHGKTRMGKDPLWVVDELRELGWEYKEIGLIYDRVLALAKAGESSMEVQVRLNPSKPVKRPYVAPAWHRRAILASPSLGPELSAQVRDARNRLNI